MSFEVTGKLIKILNPHSGSSARGNWVKQEFVIETSDQYPKKICISVWGDKVDSLKSFNIGDTVKASFNIESREYNEKWYTDLRAWKLDAGGSKQNTSGGSNTKDIPPVDFESGSETEDLPF
jgi:hypothetical protein